MKREARIRWEFGGWLERHPWTPAPDTSTVQLLPYEQYMRAGIWRTKGDAATLVVHFPEGCEEPLHTHPLSDRRIDVLQGEGVFYAVRSRSLVRVQVRAGDRLWMPRGVIHTFDSEPGMVVLSHHAPYIPLEQEKAYHALPEGCTWRKEDAAWIGR